ncbi:hypothetical protein AAKU67_001893 [Oxalobacteraceae bacterium GrIS 2.11]
MEEGEFQSLKLKSASRSRIKKNLEEHLDLIKKMMDADISLPVVYEWLVDHGIDTSLTTLRRFVIKKFGKNFYLDFVERNGWQKRARILQSDNSQRNGSKSLPNVVSKPEQPGNSSIRLGNPADINNFFNKHK